MVAHLQDPDIYKYFYIGHAANGYLMVWDTPVHADSYTLYGIADMRLVACETWDSADTWAKNVAKEGVLETWKGKISLFGGERVLQFGRR